MFVCFAPRENPQIAIAVVIQNAGYGSKWAAPIGSLLVEKYLRDTLTAERVQQATVIANTNLLPGYLVRLQFITDSARAVLWAQQSGDSTRWKRYQDPVQRRLMLDTMHKATAHVTIPFGPRPRPAMIPADSSKMKRNDSATYGKIDSAKKPSRMIVRAAPDSAALKPKDKPVVQKDSSTNQSP